MLRGAPIGAGLVGLRWGDGEVQSTSWCAHPRLHSNTSLYHVCNLCLDQVPNNKTFRLCRLPTQHRTAKSRHLRTTHGEVQNGQQWHSCCRKPTGHADLS